MKKYAPYGIILGIVLLFFYKTIFFGKIPFPGDLLLSTYAPWRHVSYEGYVAGAVPSKDQYFDVIRELYPWKTEVIKQLKDKTIPLWNPYSFSGSPLLANYQSQVFYPFGVLYFLIPQIYAWTILVILQPLLGGIFMYLFATSIGLSAGAAIIAAVAFNFSSFSNVWMEFNTVNHTFLWLPLLLYLVEKGISNKRLSIAQQILFIFGLFSSITAGHPQDFINTFLFFSLYTLTRIVSKRNWNSKEKFLFALNPLSFIIIIPFLLAAPQLLPTIELFQHSARVPHDYKQILDSMLFQPSQLVLIAVQEFFGNPATKTNFLSNTYVGKAISIGIVGFFLSLFSYRIWKRSFHVTFFILSLLALLLYTVNTPLASLLYKYPIPILSTGTPTRILFLFCFCISLLSGFGFDEIKKMKSIPWNPLLCISIIMTLLWLIALFHPTLPGIIYTDSSFQTMKKSMLFASGLTCISIVLLFLSLRKKIFLYGMIGLVTFELFYGCLKFNPFVPKTFVFPENKLLQHFQTIGGIDRIWGYGTAQIEANFSTQYRLFSPDGTDPLNLSWYNEFIQSSKDGNIAQTFNRSTRSDAQIAPGYGTRDLPDNRYRLRILDALGVKYIIDRSENPKDNTTFAGDRFKEIWHEMDWTVYENKKSAPRYFLTDSVVPYNTQKEFEDVFFAPTFNTQTTVLLQKNDFESISPLSKSINSIKLLSYKPNTVTFQTNTSSKQLLYLSDTYDYGWQANIDGKSTPIYRANYAFRAIVVPAGTHDVIFTYQPSSFTWGVRLFYLGIGMMLLFFFLQFVLLKYTHTTK
jgi:hypothetical protein